MMTMIVMCCRVSLIVVAMIIWWVASAHAQFSFQFVIQEHIPPHPITLTPESVSYFAAAEHKDPDVIGSFLYWQVPADEPLDVSTSIVELEDIVRAAAAGNNKNWYDHVIFANILGGTHPTLPWKDALNFSRIMISRSAILAGPTSVWLPRPGVIATRITVRAHGARKDLYVTDPVECLIDQQMGEADPLYPWPVTAMPPCGYNYRLPPDDLVNLPVQPE